MKNTTAGRDIENIMIECMEGHQLDLKNLICIATHGVPFMIGKYVGVFTVSLRHYEDLEGSSSSGNEIFVCHYFLHLENLCAQVLNMSHVMTVVAKAVDPLNPPKNNSLKHRQFQDETSSF